MDDSGILSKVPDGGPPPRAELEPQYKQEYDRIVEAGDTRPFDQFLKDHQAATGDNNRSLNQYLTQGPLPGKILDYGTGDAGRAELDIANQTRLMEAGSKMASQYERQRLTDSLDLLPQFNNLNLDMQKQGYAAQLDAATKGEQSRLDMELKYRPQFTDSELTSQRKAFDQSLAQSKVGTRSVADLQAELMPLMNRLGIDSQSEAFRSAIGLNKEAATAANSLFDDLNINNRTLQDQQQAFTQNSVQNRVGAQQTTDMQTSLLPILNKLGIDMQDDANASGRKNAITAATQQAGLQQYILPMLNKLQIGMQDQVQSKNEGADARAYQTNYGQNRQSALGAADLADQINPRMSAIQIANQRAANAQSRTDATLNSEQMAELMAKYNPQTQAMNMANQSQANKASLQDSSTAYKAGMDLSMDYGNKLNASNLERQLAADDQSLSQSGKAMRMGANMSQELMPQINRANLGMQREADNLGMSQSVNAVRQGAALQNELLPQLNATGLENQAAGRRSALASIKETDATRYNTREQLGQQVMSDLALGDQLSDPQRSRLQNQMRGAQGARGNVLGGASAVQEILAETDYQDRMKAQRQAAAQDFVNSGDILPQFATMGASDPMRDFSTNRQFNASQISDPTRDFSVNRGAAATMSADLAPQLFAPQTGYKGADVSNPALAYQAQSGVQAYGVADPMAQFKVNSDTAKGGQYAGMSVGNSAALYNPNSNVGSVGVNNTIQQVAPNSSAAQRANPQGMFTGANISAAQPVNPLMPNFSAGGYSPNIPNFQATTTSGPNLNPTQITQSNPFQFTNGNAGTNSTGFAQQSYQQKSANVAESNKQMSSAIGGAVGMAGMAAMFM